MSKVLLEIAAFSIEAALNALKAGADRIEFCENPMEGGTTPSYGSLLLLSQLTKQPIYPIIRPRGGDFLYTDRIEFGDTNNYQKVNLEHHIFYKTKSASLMKRFFYGFNFRFYDNPKYNII